MIISKFNCNMCKRKFIEFFVLCYSFYKHFVKKQQLLPIFVFLLHSFIWHVCFFGNVEASTYQDSLKKTILSHANDTIRVDALNNLCWAYHESKPKLALRYSFEGIKLAYSINYKKGIASCINTIGVIFYNQAKYEYALKIFKISMQLHEQINNKQGVATVMNNLGNIYTNYGDYSKSLEYYRKSLELTKEFGYNSGTAGSLNNIGIISTYLGNYSEAMVYYQNALSIYESLNDSAGIAAILVNIANIYLDQEILESAYNYYNKALAIYIKTDNKTKISALLLNLSKINNRQGNLSKALHYGLKALHIAEENGNPEIVAYCLHNLGDISLFSDKGSDSFNYLTRSLGLMKNIKNKNGESRVLNSLSRLYIKNENFSNAIQYATLSLKIGQDIGALQNTKDAANALSEAYYGLGDYKNAYEYHKYFKEIHDSVYNIEGNRKIQEISAKYKSNQQKKEIELLNEKAYNQELLIKQSLEKRKIQTLLFAIVLVLIFVSVFVLYLRNLLKQKVAYALAVSKQEKNRFNEVIAAQENERKRIARDLHDSVGMLLATAKLNLSVLEGGYENYDKEEKGIIENAKMLVDQSCVEVRSISHNLMPGALIELGLIPALNDLCNKAFVVHNFEVTLSAEQINRRFHEAFEISIYRIIQEIISNTLTHAKATEVNISMKINEISLIIRIQDNGTGFDTEKIEYSKGIGWKNIFSRIALLNGEIKIESYVGKGTNINIEVPIII